MANACRTVRRDRFISDLRVFAAQHRYARPTRKNGTVSVFRNVLRARFTNCLSVSVALVVSVAFARPTRKSGTVSVSRNVLRAKFTSRLSGSVGPAISVAYARPTRKCGTVSA